MKVPSHKTHEGHDHRSMISRRIIADWIFGIFFVTYVFLIFLKYFLENLQ